MSVDLPRRLASFVEREPQLLDAARLARAHGCRILLVGGAVRDLALGRAVGDLDFVLEGRPRRFLTALARLVGHRVVTFRKRDIVDHRIRTARREWDFVERGSRSLRGEILRRDFALNAVAYDLLAGEIVDPGRGQEDLRRRRIRAMSPGVFADDPLRMLRAVRLQAEIPELALERGTATLVRTNAARLRRTSAERIKSEMDRILISDRPSSALRLLDRLGLLAQVLPELDPLRGLRQNRYHHLDAFRHTLAAVEAADDLRALARGLPSIVFAEDPLGGSDEDPLGGSAEDPLGGGSDEHRLDGSVDGPRSGVPSRHRGRSMTSARARLLRWSLILHDTGKAKTRTRGEDGEYHFYLHDQVSARIARDAMRRLRASRAEIAAVEHLVFLHLRVSIPASGGMTPRALRRVVKDAGPLTPLLVLHSLADKAASQGAGHARTMTRLRRAGRDLLEAWRLDAERARSGPPLVTGRDVMQVLGIPPGREVGRCLEEIAELRGDGTLTTREDALRHLHSRRTGASRSE